MKKLSLALLLIVSALSSCKKAGTTTIADNGCISRVDAHSSTILLSPTDMATALNLFQQNHVTVGALQFYRCRTMLRWALCNFTGMVLIMEFTPRLARINM